MLSVCPFVCLFLRPWTSKIGVLAHFFAISGCDTFQEWTAPQSVEIDQDNPQTKFSLLNDVDFNSVSFDPLGTRSPLYECIKCEYPRQNARFLPLSTDDLSAGTNIHDFKRP